MLFFELKGDFVIACPALSKAFALSLAVPMLFLYCCTSLAAPVCFRVMDATGYSGKPDLRPLKIQHVTLVEPVRWWTGVPESHEARRAATMGKMAPLASVREPIIVDLELTLTGATNVARNVPTYVGVLDWMRAGGLTGPLSFYSSVPVRDYWRAIQGPNSPPFRAWQLENDQLGSIVARVDALYPSLYTFYADQDGWVKYATANIAEAHRVGHGRPVYPFIWPQYHMSAHSLAYQNLSREYWLRELRTIRDKAEGVVIWGGWDFEHDRPLVWNDSEAWWIATKEFLAETPNVCEVIKNGP